MKPRISEKLVRSILFRRRLLEDLEDLERKALDAVREADRDFLVVRGFVLRESPSGLVISERPRQDPTQLLLPLQQRSPSPTPSGRQEEAPAA